MLTSVTESCAFAGIVQLSEHKHEGICVKDNVRSGEEITMKPSAIPYADTIFRWAYRTWLHSRIDNYTRSLHAIEAQRENDFQAERMLHRAISTTRSKLQSL